MIRTNIRGGKYSNIFEYPNIRHTMLPGQLKILMDIMVDNGEI